MPNKTIKVTSFNIRCFGTDGLYDGKFGVEGRIETLKAFIQKELSKNQILILQEIIDPSLLKNILPPNFSFKTYEHSFTRHMKVVICFENNYELIDSQTIDKTAINQKQSRPAFYGKLILKQTKEPLINIIGVHLKSGTYHTENRLKQISYIKKFITALDNDLPTLIGGDFNSHSKLITKKDLNDTELIEESLNEINLQRIKNSNFTYYTQWERECLDHIWVTKGSMCDEKLWTYNIEKHSEGYDTLYSVKTYYSEISDHLPISINCSI